MSPTTQPQQPAPSTSSRSSTPPRPPSITTSSSSSSYLSYPVAHVVSGIYRRLTEPSIPAHSSTVSPNPPPRTSSQPPASGMQNNGTYTPPHRTASPFQPPPLTPLTLRGVHAGTAESAQILTRALAEEIRLLVPPRLQLVDDWSLVYSVEQDGVSLGTLYAKCDEYRGRRSGFVLVVRDGAGGIFGAYLSDPPHPHPHYYGTGECFLWRASVLSSNPSLLSSLPPPPSTDTTNLLHRSTTLASPRPCPPNPNLHDPTSSSQSNNDNTEGQAHNRSDNTTTPDPPLIRFKAFPYSGVNDYMIFCETSYLSVGGGDGHYGLWLDGVLECGVSSACLTFGNEGLSEEGEKYEVLGVEVWYVGV